MTFYIGASVLPFKLAHRHHPLKGFYLSPHLSKDTKFQNTTPLMKIVSKKQKVALKKDDFNWLYNQKLSGKYLSTA